MWPPLGETHRLPARRGIIGDTAAEDGRGRAESQAGAEMPCAKHLLRFYACAHARWLKAHYYNVLLLFSELGKKKPTVNLRVQQTGVTKAHILIDKKKEKGKKN